MTDDELRVLARARSAQWHARQRLTPVVVPTPRRQSHRLAWIGALILSVIAWAVVASVLFW